MALERLLPDLLEAAASRIRSGNCGFTAEEYEMAFKTVQGWLGDKMHYDELTAREDIARLYYYKDETTRVFAPFFTKEEVLKAYSIVADRIPEYNEWDFAVTMNLMYSDYYDLLAKWGAKHTLIDKVRDLSVKFLEDEDTMHPEDKIWWYMHQGH